MRGLIALLLMLIALPVSAQPFEPEWRQAREEQVLVRPGRFEPGILRLDAGRPTRLVFYNSSRVSLSVSGRDFFGNARVRDGDLAAEEGGHFILAPGQTRAITLVPATGRYRINSGSWFRRVLGMSARIIVEPAESAEN